jgi:hypothetical protein
MRRAARVLGPGGLAIGPCIGRYVELVNKLLSYLSGGSLLVA